MLKDHINLISLGGPFAELAEKVRGGVPCSAFGVQLPEKCLIAAGLETPVLYIAPTAVAARRAVEEIGELSGKKAVYLCAKDDVVLFKRSFDKTALHARLTALYEAKAGAEFIVTTPEALIQLFPKDVLSVTVEEGREYLPDKLAKSLVRMGYVRGETLSGKGTFSVRGDIFDIFPINSDSAYRIEFFGDEAEKIHYIDINTGLKGESVKSVTAVMATDVIIDDDERTGLVAAVDRSYSKARGFTMTRSSAVHAAVVAALEAGASDDCLQFILPLIKSVTDDPFAVLPGNITVVIDECKQVKENVEAYEKEHGDRVARFLRSGEAFDFTAMQLSPSKRLFGRINMRKRVAVQTLMTANGIFNPLDIIRFNCTAVPTYSRRAGDPVTDVFNWNASGYGVIVCAADRARVERFAETLWDRGVPCEVSDEPPEAMEDGVPAKPRGVKITTFVLGAGFVLHDAKLVVIGSGDLYLKSASEKKLRKRRNDLFSAPTEGDYAVHEQYGVGIVRGTKRIETTLGVKDYIAVEYAEGDVLYVSVEQMDRLTKYLAGEEKPKLNRLGGKDFERIKERVRRSIREMTINLRELYRERSGRHGYRFEPDDELSKMFADAFEYEETEDQLASIAEIEADMESDKVMDRLLCGDVGFGKTEVALRAAFKAVKSGKQVALVAPTTILSRQHYETAVKRFEGFGVRVDYINRFKSAAEQKKTLLMLEKGDIDLIVGTHRLFGKDVKFYDLGLLILDEEQRFGVEHKEKIKTLKTNVDTLTMTATPIPRTLHMSLTGIRDISTINTPPATRIPVRTYVAEETDELIRDAISRELARGGQAFVLYNRVETINKYAADLAAILPEQTRIVVAHGRMNERELEDTVSAFYAGEADVLVSTTIIENGIDLPNANTLIVIDADRLGLSTLYQLKGRVGRSDRVAHAYFTFKPDKVMNDAAYKRLNAIMEFADMGSGFRIAMRDLEIRGAGNVLGREQHGHMDKVGYELYSKLLKEELGETETGDCEIDVAVDAFIPENYIGGGEARMDCYKQIAEIKNSSDAERILSSLADVYGKPPEEVTNLVSIACLRRAAAKLGAVKVTMRGTGGEIIFPSVKSLDNEKLYNALKAEPAASLSVGTKPSIKLAFGGDRVQMLGKILRFCDIEG